jgi:hypothetical protein
MSKAQMEIIGLVMIVILLAMGLLFAVVILTKSPSTEVTRVKESIQAANFLNTILSTTTACDKRDVQNLLQDCATSSYENGEWIGADQCSTGNTCEVAKETIEIMLDKTLKEWNKDYVFFINGTRAIEPIKIQSGECGAEREGKTRQVLVRTGLDIFVTLHICN